MSDNLGQEDAVKQLASEFEINKPSQFRSDKSTKQIIKDICDAVIYLQNEKKDEGKRNEWDIISALNGLAVAALAIFVFSVSKGDDTDFWERMKLYAYILSVTLSAIWIGVNIERTPLFRELWKFGITKLIISLFFTALVVFSTATASSTINGIFGIDASFFPFTRSFLTAYTFFRYVSQLVYLLLFVAFLNLFPIFAYFKYRLDKKHYVEMPVKSFVFIILTLVFSYFIWGWSGSNFDSNTLNEKVYLLAHQLDFNDNNLCVNLKGEKVSVIFLGQNQVQMLVDYNIVKPENISNFVEDHTIYGIENKNLKIMSCDY